MQAKDMQIWDSGNFINEGVSVQPSPQPEPAPQPSPQPINSITKAEVDSLLDTKLNQSLLSLKEDLKIYIKDSLDAYDILQDEETKQYFESAMGNLELVDIAAIDAKYTDESEVSTLASKEITLFRADLYNKALADYNLMLKKATVAKLTAYLAKLIQYIKPV